MGRRLTISHDDTEPAERRDDGNGGDDEVFHLEDVPEFWASFVGASIGVTIVIMVTKVLLTVAYGFWSGFEIEMNRVFNVIPQFVFGRGQARFEHMVRASWVLSSCGTMVWWLLRGFGTRSERREIDGMKLREKHTDREREELRYGLFVAEAHRTGSWIGLWTGSLGLLGILGFEYVRKWVIDDIEMPPFPFWALLVALIPLGMLAKQWASRSELPTLRAADIAGLLDETKASESATTVEHELQRA